MAISLESGLRHMAWANQKVYKAVEALPEEALQSFIVNPEWTAYEMLYHTCTAAGGYAYRVGQGEKPAEIAEPAKVSTLRELIEKYDRQLIALAAEDDRDIVFHRDGKEIHRWASTILTQAMHHATEHRAQLIDALEYKSYKVINLDDIDLWAFDEFEKNG